MISHTFMRVFLASWIASLLLGVMPSLHAAPLDAALQPLDSRTTNLPVYWLPKDAKVDGDLRKWRGVPAAVLPELFKVGETQALITPDDDFAPSIYLGRPRGSADLFILVVLRDGYCLPLESSAWVFGDCLELFLDYGRERRDTEHPEWWKEPGKWSRTTNAPEMSQFGFLPQAPGKPAELMKSPATRDAWKVDYASVPIRGGYVYEIRVDAASVLKDVKLDTLPAVIGFDVMIRGTDYPIVLDGAGWNNHRGYVRLFGDYSVTSRPVSYGGVALEPREPKGNTVPGRTLKELYGNKLTLRDLRAEINRNDDAAIAELLYWQLWNSMVPDRDSIARIVSEPWPKSREIALLAMLDAQQDEETRRVAARSAFTAPLPDSPRAQVAACLLHKALGEGQGTKLLALLEQPNMTVMIAAASALASTGSREEFDAFRTRYPQLLEAAGTTPEAAALRLFVKPSLDEMQFRFDPPLLPQAKPLREISARNSDLPRLFPVDNNTVYDGAGLLRSWPKEGPRELWRYEIGTGYAGVTEAGGRAYIMASKDGKTWGLCIDAEQGELIWRKELLPGIEGYSGVTPVLDGNERVYFSMNGAVACLRAVDGEEIWRENKLFAGSSFSTPLIAGDLLLIPGKKLVAVDKQTGAMQWKTDMPGASPASPALQELDGITQVILGVGSAPNSEVWGINLADGEVFWKFPLRNGYGLCNSPVVHGTRVLVSCGETGMEHYTALQMFVTEEKIRCIPALVRTDVQTSFANTMAIWDGAVYGYGGGGLECIDPDTGTVFWRAPGKWKNDLHVIVADGLAFVQTDNDLVLVEADKTAYREVGRVTIPVFAGRQQPSIANGRLFVRGETWVVCYRIDAE